MKYSLFERIFLKIAGKTVRAPDWLINWILGEPHVLNGRTLDRRIQWLLWLGKWGFQPQLHELAPVKARKAQRFLFDMLEEEHAVDVRSISDHVIDAGVQKIPARLYKSWGCEGAQPVILFYHGGGFVLGDIDMYDRICRRLCEGARCAVLSIDYRLAPECPFPAAIDDCWAAFLWLQKEASRLGLAADRIAVGGDSAGGGLAAAVTTLALDRGEALPVAQLLIYPGLTADGAGRNDPSIARGYGFDLETLQWFTDQYVSSNDYDDSRASPIHAKKFKGLPRTLIYTAGFDLLRQEAQDYAEVLKREGVPVSYHCFESLTHGFMHMPFVPAVKDASHQMYDALHHALNLPSVRTMPSDAPRSFGQAS